MRLFAMTSRFTPKRLEFGPLTDDPPMVRPVGQRCARPAPPVDLGNGPEPGEPCAEPYAHSDGLHRTAAGRTWCTTTEDVAAVLAFLHRAAAVEPSWGYGTAFLEHLARLAREEASDS